MALNESDALEFTKLKNYKFGLLSEECGVFTEYKLFFSARICPELNLPLPNKVELEDEHYMFRGVEA